MRNGDDSIKVELLHKSSLKDIELVFDHNKIFEDANLLN